MLCDACKKNNATIHYFESIDGRARTLNLCESCAALKGIAVNLTAISFESFMKLAPEMARPVERPEPPISKICIGCGMNYADFRHNPARACPACMDTFFTRDELVKRARSFQPAKADQKKKPVIGTSEAFALAADARVDGLRKLMQQAIELEEFEEAARLRDLIKEAVEGAKKA